MLGCHNSGPFSGREYERPLIFRMTLTTFHRLLKTASPLQRPTVFPVFGVAFTIPRIYDNNLGNHLGFYITRIFSDLEAESLGALLQVELKVSWTPA